jgi:ATP-dependent exoDNAse (exonuclease V) alpha subunit
VWTAAAAYRRPDVFRDIAQVQILIESFGHAPWWAAEQADSFIQDVEFTDALLEGRLTMYENIELPTPIKVDVDNFSRAQRKAFFRAKRQLDIRAKYRHDEDEELDEDAWIFELAQEKATYIEGNPGTGKTTVAIAIAHYALSLGFKVRFSLPAARLIHDFRMQVPEATFGTVHSHFGIRRSGPSEILQDPQDDELWIIDEVWRLEEKIVDHIMVTRREAKNWPAVIFMGDPRQLGAIGDGNAATSNVFHTQTTKMKLVGSQRSGDPALLYWLDLMREHCLDSVQVEELTRKCLIAEQWNENDIDEYFANNGQGAVTFLTVTNAGSETINEAVLRHFAAQNSAARQVPVWVTRRKITTIEYLTLFPGARIMITLNKNVKKGLINGAVAIVLMIDDRRLSLQLPGRDKPVSLSLTHMREGKRTVAAFSVAGGYAMTIHKAQGLTIRKIVIYWDHFQCQPGLAYTAISRTKMLEDVKFICRPKVKCFTPNV